MALSEDVNNFSKINYIILTGIILLMEYNYEIGRFFRMGHFSTTLVQNIISTLISLIIFVYNVM